MHKDFKYFFDDQDNLVYNAEKYPITASIIRAARRAGGRDWKMLDLGTYTGIFYAAHLPELLERSEVWGTDINPDYIEAARSRNIKMVEVNFDTEPLPYTPGTFDLVLFDSALEHTLRPKEMFEEIARVLKPGGTLLISVPSAGTAQRRWRTLRGDNPFHPLIDNLINRGYMKRCAIFYDIIDAKAAMGPAYKVKDVQYLNQPYHDPKTIMMKVLRLWGRFVPTVRDTMIITAIRQ